MRATGCYQKLGSLSFFIPHPLPPDPPLNMTSGMITLYGEASAALAKLDDVARRVPYFSCLLRAYVIKEALLSSAIENIHTMLVDVFRSSMEGAQSNKNTQLVMNYTKALDVAVKMLAEENFPLSTRVILSAHAVLMSAGTGEGADPGQWRKQSVQVGHLTPPPAIEIPHLFSTLEKYINEPSELPPLIRAGLVHVQFETIHPFLDGNGRIGRLLIVLMLINDKLLHAPILYPSYFFKKNHQEYYQRLNAVRVDGDFEGWILYYLNAIKDSAIDAYRRADEISELRRWIITQIKENLLKRTHATAEMILDCFFKVPVTSISNICQLSGKSFNTVNHVLIALSKIEKSGFGPIISEMTDNKRNKLYRFDIYLFTLETDLSE